MAEIARDAILYGGKDVAKAEAAANDLLKTLIGAGCEDAKAAPLSRKAAASLSEARSVIVILAGEGDGAQEPTFDRFWRYFKKSADRVEALKTAVLDVGDGALGALVEARFAALGSAPICANGYTQDEVVAALKPTAASAETSKTRLCVLYASQTGNAESIAKDIKVEVEARHPTCDVVAKPLDAWRERTDGWETLGKGSVCVLIASTTGNGDAPDNGERFWRYVRKRAQPDDLFEGVKYCVLGLGDTNYDKFCHVGKVLDGRLSEVGATRFYARGDADEALGLEYSVDPWLRGLWPALFSLGLIEDGAVRESIDLGEAVPVAACMNATAEGHLISGFDAAKFLKHNSKGLDVLQLPKERSLMSDDAVLEAGDAGRAGAFTASKPFEAPVVGARVLADANGRRVVHVELDLTASGALYEPGDSVGVRCPNDAESLKAAAAALGMSEVTSADLINNADLSAAPSRNVLRSFAGWCADDGERNLCLALAARPAGKLLYDACIARPRLTAHELLAALPSCKPPSEAALAGALPKLSARYYSVASSPLAADGAGRKEVVALCFSVVAYQAGAGTNAAHALRGEDRIYERHGLCTTWLDALVQPLLDGTAVSTKVPCFLKPSEAFSLPEDPDAPILMVGPGTGVAPFVGFLEHRARKRRALQADAAAPPPGARPAMPGARPAMPGARPAMPGARPAMPGARPAMPGARPAVRRAAAKPKTTTTTLYFGCRARDVDWLYRERMQAHASGGLDLRLAFSREGPDAKVYVQHLVKEDAKKVAQLLTDGVGRVYVCGDGANMARDVHHALAHALVVAGKAADEASALAALKALKKDGRLLHDIWSPVDGYED